MSFIHVRKREYFNFERPRRYVVVNERGQLAVKSDTFPEKKLINVHRRLAEQLYWCSHAPPYTAADKSCQLHYLYRV